jgi:ABC-type lipoprotein export system ATPase subunit
MVTHDHALLHHCDRVLEMTDGVVADHVPHAPAHS